MRSRPGPPDTRVLRQSRGTSVTYLRWQADPPRSRKVGPGGQGRTHRTQHPGLRGTAVLVGGAQLSGMAPAASTPGAAALGPGLTGPREEQGQH